VDLCHEFNKMRHTFCPDHHNTLVHGNTDVIHRTVRHVGGSGVHPAAETGSCAEEGRSRTRPQGLYPAPPAYSAVRRVTLSWMALWKCEKPYCYDMSCGKLTLICYTCSLHYRKDQELVRFILWEGEARFCCPGGRAVSGVDPRPVGSWDCGFECRLGQGCLSLVSVVLSGRGLCDGPITRREEPYRMCVTECDQVHLK